MLILATEMGSSITYEDLGYAAGDHIANVPVVIGLQRKITQENNKWGLFLVDQNKKELIGVDLAEPATPGPLEISGNLDKRALPAGVGSTKAFLNYDDRLFFIADENKIHSLLFNNLGGLILHDEFTKLISHQNITGMAFGDDRFNFTTYPTFFITSDEIYDQHFVVDEFAFNPATRI